jgi:hypothetical protein
VIVDAIRHGARARSRAPRPAASAGSPQPHRTPGRAAGGGGDRRRGVRGHRPGSGAAARPISP